MSKKSRKDDDQSPFDAFDDQIPVLSPPEPTEPTEPAVEEPVAAPPVEEKRPEVLLTFDRWFALSGKPAHHKAGMIAFGKKVSGKRPMSAWDAMFKDY